MSSAKWRPFCLGLNVLRVHAESRRCVVYFRPDGDHGPVASDRASPCATEACLGLTHWGRDKMTAIFRTTFSNAFYWLKMLEFGLKKSMKFVPKVRINNIVALVQIIAWRQSGDKSLSEPIVVSLLTHICVTRPQWGNIALCSTGAVLWWPWKNSWEHRNWPGLYVDINCGYYMSAAILQNSVVCHRLSLD